MTEFAYTPSGRSPRLFVDADLSEGTSLALTAKQAHYVRNVLRMRTGEAVRLFNGYSGEWQAEIAGLSRKGATLTVRACTRRQGRAGDLHLLFAPLKQARLDYSVQKATELGASLLQPVTTAHTQVTRVNAERMWANAVEAAEQCGLLSVPRIEPLRPLVSLLSAWPDTRALVFADEAAGTKATPDTLCGLADRPLAVLVGPEGGFSDEERDMLRALEFVVPISLGPRVLRADTAAVAALTLVQAAAGDWR